MGGWDAPWHWVVLGIIVIALFGYKRLPDAARSLGRSMRVFKTEIKGLSEDDKKRAEHAEQAKAIEAPRVVDAQAGLAHNIAETAPRPRPRPRPVGGEDARTAS